MVLKCLRHLECVDLSGNDMTEDSVKDMVTLIRNNNRQIRRFCLPNCFISQANLILIVQALRTVTFLGLLDFTTNTVNGEIITDIINYLVVKELKVSKLICNPTDFHYISDHLYKLKGFKIDLYIQSVFSEIYELTLSSCQIRIDQLHSLLSQCMKLKYLDLSSCHFNSTEMRIIFGVLKLMNYLQCINLSGNKMKYLVANDIASMIINNKSFQKICLPDCIFNQASFRIIVRAMQTALSLQYVDFNATKIDNNLASDIPMLFTNQLQQLNFSDLTLNQSGFKHLKTHMAKLKGLKCLKITDCTFTNQDVALVETFICCNHKIQELIISNCKVIHRKVIIAKNYIDKTYNLFNQLQYLRFDSNRGFNCFIHKLSVFLSCNSKLKQISLSKCQLQSNEIKQILMILKYMNHLEYVDLYGNIMEDDDSVSDMETMIVSNKQLQRLCLPNCILAQTSLRIIIQALQTVSLLQYVDFSMNKVDNELADDVAVLMANNKQLNGLKLSHLLLNHNCFQYFRNHLEKIKGLKLFSINCFNFTREDGAKLVTTIINNPEINELNLSNCIMEVDQFLSILFNSTKMKRLDLSNCRFYSKEIEQIFSVLKQIENLQCVSLSENFMTISNGDIDIASCDTVHDTIAMMKNNKRIWSLSLPVLNCKYLRIMFKAIDTCSLECVDFGTSEVDNELASDVATLFANNIKLKELRFAKLILEQWGFQNLKKYWVRLNGLKHLSIADCLLTDQDVIYLETVISINHNTQELIILNCKTIGRQVVTMVGEKIDIYNQLKHLELSNSAINHFVDKLTIFLSVTSKLKQTFLCNCQLRPNEIKQILMVLKYMSHLETVDLSGNTMTDDSVDDMEAMIVNNKLLKRLYFPNCILNQTSLKCLIKAFYVDYSAERIDELANAILMENNNLASLDMIHLLDETIGVMIYVNHT